MAVTESKSVFTRVPTPVYDRIEAQRQHQGVKLSRAATIAMLLAEALTAREEAAKRERNERRSR